MDRKVMELTLGEYSYRSIYETLLKQEEMIL